MEFKSEGDKVRLAQSSSLATVSNLLSVDQNELGRALCHRVIAANGELMEKGHTSSEAVFGRDAFAKVITRPVPWFSSIDIAVRHPRILCRPCMTVFSLGLWNESMVPSKYEVVTAAVALRVTVIMP